jgi:hypothetical protein
MGATLYKTSTLEQVEPEILTMADIEAMSRNMNIPSLMMTATSQFDVASFAKRNAN